MSDRAGQARAVNTAGAPGRPPHRAQHRRPRDPRPRCGSGYDGPVDRAVILGGGATAASALLGLADLGCRQVTLLVRDAGRAAATVATAAPAPAGPPRSPCARWSLAGGAPEGRRAGLHDPAAAQTAGGAGRLADVPVVFDVVYDPWPTPLAAAAARAGGPSSPASTCWCTRRSLQVELMTGCSPAPLDAMRRVGAAVLADRSGDVVHRPRGTPARDRVQPLGSSG